MNGIHDMGGMHGMGPVEAEPNEPVFHDRWEARVLALTLAMGFHGRWNIDRGRYFRENRHPLDYLSSTYYEIWLKGLEALAVDAGFVRADELAAGRSLVPPSNDAPVAPGPAESLAIVKQGGSFRRPQISPPRFKAGDAVRVRFEGAELWGKAAGPKDAVYIDLWDDYLEAAP